MSLPVGHGATWPEGDLSARLPSYHVACDLFFEAPSEEAAHEFMLRLMDHPVVVHTGSVSWCISKDEE